VRYGTISESKRRNHTVATISKEERRVVLTMPSDDPEVASLLQAVKREGEGRWGSTRWIIEDGTEKLVFEPSDYWRGANHGFLSYLSENEGKDIDDYFVPRAMDALKSWLTEPIRGYYGERPTKTPKLLQVYYQAERGLNCTPYDIRYTPSWHVVEETDKATLFEGTFGTITYWLCLRNHSNDLNDILGGWMEIIAAGESPRRVKVPTPNLQPVLEEWTNEPTSAQDQADDANSGQWLRELRERRRQELKQAAGTAPAPGVTSTPSPTTGDSPVVPRPTLTVTVREGESLKFGEVRGLFRQANPDLSFFDGWEVRVIEEEGGREHSVIAAVPPDETHREVTVLADYSLRNRGPRDLEAEPRKRSKRTVKSFLSVLLKENPDLACYDDRGCTVLSFDDELEWRVVGAELNTEQRQLVLRISTPTPLPKKGEAGE
jgi:hypothetical protein